MPAATPLPATIIVHDRDHAAAALAAAEAAGVKVRLESAANAAAQGGVLWFAAVIEAAREKHPRARFDAVLDCGCEAGRALGAIRELAHHDAPIALRSRAPRAARAKIAAIARAAGVAMATGRRGRVLDLLDAPDPAAAATAFLAPPARGRRRGKSARAARPDRLQKA